MSSYKGYLLPGQDVLDAPHMAIEEYLHRFEVFNDIEFTPGAREMFFDAFQLFAEKCIEEREDGIEEVRDELKNDIQKAKDEAEEAATEHDKELEETKEQHAEALEQLKEQHEEAIRQLKMDHQQDLDDLEAKHEGEIIRLRASLSEQLRVETVEGARVLVTRRRKSQRATAWEHIRGNRDPG